MTPAIKGLSFGFMVALGSTVACASNSSTVRTEPPANAREAGAPDSTDNKNLPSPMAPANTAATNARDARDPNSVDNKDLSGVPPQPGAVHQQELRAAEAGNPNSVDSTLPSAAEVIQRVYVFDQSALEAGHLAEKSGGPGGQAYGKRLVRDRMENAQRLSDLAGKNHTSLLDKDLSADQRTRKLMKEMKDENNKLAGLSGVSFDRVFSEHIARVAERDLKEVTRLRGHCVEPQVCAMLDDLVPVLERERDDGQKLHTASSQLGVGN